MQQTTCLSGLAFMALVSASVTQVHIGLSSEAVGCKDGVSVAFASDSTSSLEVKYGVGATDKSATTTFSHYDINSPNYTYSSPTFHTAMLCNLLSNTQYKYTVQDFSGSFKSIPEASKKTVLSVVGDIGLDVIGDTVNNILSDLKGSTPDAIIIAGDWAYANGCHKDWDKWMKSTQAMFSKVPMLGINGNHEVIVAGGIIHAQPECLSEMYTGYINRIVTPITPEASKDFRTWYSKDIGNIHAIFLDDYTGIIGPNNIGSDYWFQHRNQQFEFLKKDLASVDRTKTPYIIVFKHNTYYSSWVKHQCQCSSVKFEIDDPESCWKGNYYMNQTAGAGELGDTRAEPHCGLQAKFEDVYMQYGVDAVIAGHVHCYERTAPIYKNKINPDGITYITVGTGGHGHYQGAISPIQEWSKSMSDSYYGMSRVIADDDKMTIHFRANGETTTLFDSVEIPRRKSLLAKH
uniref:Purple acid phosphatase n=2 Tax=Thraustotheca clavata TaxID=74557 RepID=A0A0A7CM36_9STRA|nr:secreted protein [Thraustotheca clavata]